MNPTIANVRAAAPGSDASRRTSVLTELVGFLRCPVCATALHAAPDGAGPHGAAPHFAGPPALRCDRGHAFDVARQGYVNLSAGRLTHPGDTAGMVAARQRFLASGGYGFVTAAIAALAAETLAAAAARGTAPAGLVLDAGAGTGHHLGGVLDTAPGTVGLALDVSKPALRRAARAHPRAAAALADTWRGLPVADHCAAVLLNLFAPRNGAEFRRALRPDGALLTVTPEADHLAELVGRLDLLRVDAAKADRLAGSLDPWFRPAAGARHSRTLPLSRAQVADLVAMGPSARHAEPGQLAAAIAALPEPVPVTAAVRVTRWRPV
jgi:23S rRNA (guanine745-N1)-methyltransferase